MGSAPTQRIELTHGQSLVLTPQLQQSLKILQYSSQELREYLEEELEKNPLLAKDETTSEERSADEGMGDAEGDDTADKDGYDEAISETAVSGDQEMDTSHDNDWDAKENENIETGAEHTESFDTGLTLVSGGKEGGGARGGGNDSEYSFLDQASAEMPSLREYLLEQVQLEFATAPEKLIASQLVDQLDESGYFLKDIKEMAEILDVPADQITAVLERLQTFEPSGIFARDLAGCLRVQLEERNHLDPAMAAMLDNLYLIGEGKFDKLAKICGVDNEDIRDMLAEIRTLNPKPGASYENNITQVVVPDIYVRKQPGSQDWTLELNCENLPRLLVDRHYYGKVKKQVVEGEQKKYLSQQYASANWLVKALNQRAETILKVSAEIIAQQQEFLEKGIQYLKPMTLRAIAEIVGVHESTVGRVTSNKYMATPRGTYELKFFFSSGLGNVVGIGDHSSRSVKHTIKEMIDKEESLAILSDDKLAEMLQAKGIDIARRTVAKYRESLHIPSSSERRRMKKMQRA